MESKVLQIQQLDRRISDYSGLEKVAPPVEGWIKTIRTALGMSMQQLGKRLSVTKQSVKALEAREQQGTLTINALRDAANALDMHLVYGFVPNDGSLEELIERRAMELARQIVLRTDNTMRLEDQENTRSRIEKSIKERAAMIRNEMPRVLWD